MAGAICEWVGENDTHKCTGSQFAAEGIDCNISNSKQGRQFPQLPPGGNLRWSKKVSFEGVLSPLKTVAVKYQPDKHGSKATELKGGRFLQPRSVGAEVYPQNQKAVPTAGIMMWLLSFILRLLSLICRIASVSSVCVSPFPNLSNRPAQIGRTD